MSSVHPAAERLRQIASALRAGEQADADGVMVKVSRQACEEAAAELDALAASKEARFGPQNPPKSLHPREFG